MCKMDTYFECGFFVDVGANHGIGANNKTDHLQHVGGTDKLWSGVCIDASPNIFGLLKKNRQSRAVTCINACIVSEKKAGLPVEFLISDVTSLSSGIIYDGNEEDSPLRWNTEEKILKYCEDTDQKYKTVSLIGQSLCQILKNVGAPKEIHYLKLDIEGAEEDVISDFCFKEYKVYCIEIEQATEKTYNKLSEEGFVYVGGNSVDDWFVNKNHPSFSKYIELAFNAEGERF